MNKLIVFGFILFFLTACIQEPRGQATEVIQENDLNSVNQTITEQEITEHQDINSTHKLNWWGLVNYLLLVD